MIKYEKQFSSKEKAEEFCNYVMSEYSPLGYDTRLQILQNDSGWLVIGSRLSCCD